MTENQDDLDLINAFKNGEEAAFEGLVIKYQDRIYNLCRHMLGDPHDADDAAQETFIKAYKNLKAFRPEASLYTWLYRIAINTCIDHKRRPFFGSFFKRSSEGEDFAIEQESVMPSPERLYESKQTGVAIKLALNKLSDKLRTVIVLKEIEGLS